MLTCWLRRLHPKSVSTWVPCPAPGPNFLIVQTPRGSANDSRVCIPDYWLPPLASASTCPWQALQALGECTNGRELFSLSNTFWKFNKEIRFATGDQLECHKNGGPSWCMMGKAEGTQRLFGCCMWFFWRARTSKKGTLNPRGRGWRNTPVGCLMILRANLLHLPWTRNGAEVFACKNASTPHKDPWGGDCHEPHSHVTMLRCHQFP